MSSFMGFLLIARLKLEERRKTLVKKLEETTKLTTYLHLQLKSLSASTLSVSSGSSLGSLASSRGSLNTSSRGSLNSLSSTDLYYNQGDQTTDLDYQYKLDFMLQEKCGYIPSGPITTIHENEVVNSHGRMGYSDSSGSSAASYIPKLTEPPKSVTSLSSRSSLSSLSPPGSPLVLEGAFSVLPQDSPLHHLTADFEDCDLPSDFAGINLCENQMLSDSETRTSSQSLADDKDLSENVRQITSPSRSADVDLPRRTVGQLLEEKAGGCVSAAVSDESVAGDSGVYEASVKQPNDSEEAAYGEDDGTVLETAQVQIGLRYDTNSSSFVIIVVQLQNLHVLSVSPGSKVYFRVAVLPSSADISCLFRTKVHPAAETLLFSEMFRVAISQASLHQKTLRVDICSVSKTCREECLAGTQISLADLSFSNETSTLWYNLLACKQVPGKKDKEPKEDPVFVPVTQLSGSLDLDAVSALLERTSAELEAVEQELAEEEEEEEEEKEVQDSQSAEQEWLGVLAETSSKSVTEEEDPVKAVEGGAYAEDDSFCSQLVEANEVKEEEDGGPVDVCRNELATVSPTLVDKETNTEGESVVVRSKDRASLKSQQQHPFVRNSMIVRSQTFSPGERNQYICRESKADLNCGSKANKAKTTVSEFRRHSKLRFLRRKCVCERGIGGSVHEPGNKLCKSFLPCKRYFQHDMPYRYLDMKKIEQIKVRPGLTSSQTIKDHFKANTNRGPQTPKEHKMAAATKAVEHDAIPDADSPILEYLKAMKASLTDRIDTLTSHVEDIKLSVSQAIEKADSTLENSLTNQANIKILDEHVMAANDRLTSVKIEQKATNLKFRGFPEEAEGSEDLITFIASFIAQALKLEKGIYPVITNATRLGSKNNTKRTTPRAIVATIPDIRLNRSDSDSSTLAKKSLFVRNATERRSLRVKRPACQPNMRRATQERPVRTSLDLELDLQASRTRQSRLNDELQTLRELKLKLEDMKARGETELPPCVLEDERFQKLLKQAEKQAEQSKEEKKRGLSAEKLMRKASKDVCRLREQSQKVPLQVQSFREKIAYFTRAKISIPSLPADDV
ncbi:UNVERIFIED_CONTAM: hypothetical protein K2H54_054621 [Gekko kuhli]